MQGKGYELRVQLRKENNINQIDLIKSFVLIFEEELMQRSKYVEMNSKYLVHSLYW